LVINESSRRHVDKEKPVEQLVKWPVARRRSIAKQSFIGEKHLVPNDKSMKSAKPTKRSPNRTTTERTGWHFSTPSNVLYRQTMYTIHTSRLQTTNEDVAHSGRPSYAKQSSVPVQVVVGGSSLAAKGNQPAHTTPTLLATRNRSIRPQFRFIARSRDS